MSTIHLLPPDSHPGGALVPGGRNGGAPAPAYPGPRAGDLAAPPERLDVREVGRMLARNWLLVAGITLLGAAGAAYLTYTQPPAYESEATVRLTDARRALAGSLGADAIEQRVPGGRDPILTQVQVLRSRTLLGRTVDRTGLRLQPLGGAAPGLVLEDVAVDARSDTIAVRFDADRYTATAGQARASAAYGTPVTLPGIRFTVRSRPSVAEASLLVVSRETAIARLAAGLGTRPRERTDIVDLTYRAGDPELARRVLDGLVAEFQAADAQQAQQISHRRREFIEEQLQETDAQLQQGQMALSAFREQQQGYSSRDRFATEQSGAMGLEVRREELEADRQLVRTLLARLDRPGEDGSLRALVASPAIASNPVVTQLYTQLVRYEEQRDSLTTGTYRASPNNPDLQRVESLVASTRTRIGEAVRSQLASLDARIVALDNLLARRQERLQAIPGVEAEEARLSQQVAATQTVADQLRMELQKARIAEAVEAGQVEVVDPASLPGSPIPAHNSLRLAVGVLLGLVVGTGVAFLREQVNTSIRSRDEVEDLLQTGTLATIPRVSDGPGRERAGWFPRRRETLKPGAQLPPEQRLVAAYGVRSSAAEAYRTLRTNLIFSQTRQQLRTVVVTSAGPAEGKTTTSCNLAATFAQQGMRVVLVDCDLRRPRVHEVFGARREPGLTQLVLGHNTVEEAVVPTSISNLFILPSGTLPPNPSELLGSEGMGRVLESLRAAFDLVVLDTPPVLLAPDASVVGAGADGVLLVVRAGVTDREALRRARQQMDTVGARVLGGVLNDVDGKATGYGTYYASYYGAEE